MKRIYLLTVMVMTLALSLSNITSFAQAGVFDPSDPEIVFTSTYQPAAPAWGKISKWGHTQKLSWNTFTAGFKCYYYKGMAFRLKFPKTYQHNVADGKTYPVFIFLHGLGEKGPIYDNDQSLLWGGQLHGQKVDDGTFDGFLIYPQNQTGYFPAYFGAISEIVDSMVKYVKADQDRVTLSGLSAGAQGDWEFTADYSKYFASLIPISAARFEDTPYFNRYVTIPIWTANGGQDINPDPAAASLVFSAFKRLGGSLQQTFYPNQGHSVWTSFWSIPSYFPYLSTTHKANPLVFFGRTQFCPNDPINVTLGVQDGFYSYEWQKDGVTIPGANSSRLQVTQIGTYRVHFKRTATSNWSLWSPTPVVISIKTATITPPIQVNGTFSTVLPATDGNTTVPLMVPNNYVSYEWRRVSDSAVVGTSNIFNAPVGQYIVKVTEQYGCSSNFSPAFSVIPAAGTNVPDKVSNVTAISQSNTSVQLDWSDNPHPINNETGFEIYRATNAGGPYTLININPADNLSYLDQSASPNTKYFYVIRPVNNNGAAPLSQEVSVTTKSDTQPPTAPGNLRIGQTTRNSITLNWNPSTDDVGIGKYIIYINGVRSYTTTDFQFTVNNLDSFKTYNFYVKAQDQAGNLSPQSNQVTGIARNAGLSYKYYETASAWSKLPDFNSLTPVITGTTANVTISLAQKTTNYGFLWQGYISIRTAGTYLFETNSDDGSRLYIGSYSATATPVVDNDGAHGTQYKGGNYTFSTPGMYPIAITYFQAGGGQAMNVYWTCAAAGIPTRTAIPDSAFVDFVPAAGTAPSAPSSLKAVGVSYNKVQLNWSDNSSNETGFEVYRSTTLNGSYNTIAVLPANASSYVDSTCNASTKYYYKVRAIGTFGESPFTQNGIEAQWAFNNNYNDSSGNNQTLTLVGGTPTFDNAGAPEGSYSWKNNLASATINSTNNFLKEIYSARTIAFWMKSTDNTSRVVLDIGGSDNGIAASLSNSNLLVGVASNNTRVQISTPYSSLAWNHIAIVYNKNSISLYVNGVLKASNNNLSFSSILSTTNGSRIANSNGTNALNSSGSNFNGWIDNFEIINSALNQTEVTALMNNTFNESAAVTNPLPAVPAAPTNLVSTATSSSAINVTWNDNSTTETGFEVWRSTNNNTTYRLIATLPAGSVNYKDSGLYANVTYYYKVRAFGTGGFTAYTNEGSAKTLNIPPSIVPIADVTMRYDGQKTIAVNTINLDGDSVTVSVSNLPSFATFTSNGSNGSIFINPNGQQGTFAIQVSAVDNNGGSATQTFNLIVNSNYPPTINAISDITMPSGTSNDLTLTATDPDGLQGLTWSSTNLPSFATISTNTDGSGTLHLAPGYGNFGTYSITITATDVANGKDQKTFNLTVTNNIPATSTVMMSIRNYPYSNPAPSPWNSISTLTSNNLLDQNGNATPIGLAFQTPAWNTESFGAVTGNNSGVYPDEVIKDHYWFGIYGRPDTVDVKITGLSKSFKYNVTLFASSNFSQFPDNGNTIYILNGVAKSLHVQNNQQQTVVFSGIVPDSSGNIIFTMKKDVNAGVGWLNSVVVSQVFDDGTVPAAPTGLVATAQADGSVKLKWTNVAYNASKYEIYRATDSTSTFTLLNPGVNNPNDTTYFDKTVLSRTTYYYKLLAVNANGNPGYTSAVGVTTLNKAPILSTLNNVFVKAGNTATLQINATDDPGETLTITVNNLPSFGQLQITGNGTGQIVFNPTANNIGVYNNVTVTVSDNYGGSVTSTFSVFVNDKNTRSIYVNIGTDLGTPADKPWNNLMSYPFPNLVLSNLKDESDIASGYNFTIVDQFAGRFTGGMITGNNTGVYPDIVSASAFYENTNSTRTFKFSGLNSTKLYNVAILSSINTGVSAKSTFSSQGKSITVDARYNSNLTAQLNGLTPDANGEVVITMLKDTAAPWGILNALVLEEYDTSIPIVNPINLSVIPDSTTRAKLCWSDRSSNETGFEIWRASGTSGAFSLVATVGANVTSYKDVNLTPGTKYYYEVRAKNGSITSDYSNIVNVIMSKKIVYLNFDLGESPGPYPWNNTGQQLAEGTVVANLRDNTGNNTGFSLNMITHFNDEHDEGNTTGDNSGVYPDNVIRSTFWMDKNQISSYKIVGLDQSKAYRLWFFGSFKWGYIADFTTTYTINGITVYLNCYNANSKAVYIDNVIPNQNGEIYVDVSAPSSSVYGFQSSLVIEYYDPALITQWNSNVPGLTVINPGNNPITNVAVSNTGARSEQEAIKGVSIYPNPFRNYITVSYSNASKSNLSINVYDITGKIIARKDLGIISEGSHTAVLDLGSSAITSGTYILNFVRNNKVERTFKIIKH